MRRWRLGVGLATAPAGANASSLSARMSVRRHSSSRDVGQGVAWKRANASRRRSISQVGLVAALQERLEGRFGEAAVVAGGVVVDALLIAGLFSSFEVGHWAEVPLRGIVGRPP